jgi:peptidoglycan/xylan/chitin deacetylase (PgdA/CDA1 family)
MSMLRDLAITWSDRLRLQRLFGSPADGLTILLFHDFRFGDESRDTTRERLRRQLDFLATAWRPVDIGQALGMVRDGRGQDERILMVTVDDAKRDLLEVYDLFQTFGVPVAQFVCAGWTERMQRDPAPDSLRARLVSCLHFHDGPAQDVMLGEVVYRLDRSNNVTLIDAIITTDDLEGLARLEDSLGTAMQQDRFCTWSELRDLQCQGMAVGCHSVSHPRIAMKSATRQRFEIAESRRLIETRLGPTPWFAYPYGVPGSHDTATRALLQENGFAAGFTTTPGLAMPGQDCLRLPRIVLPDVPMTDRVFQARVRGGGIPLAALRGKGP